MTTEKPKNFYCATCMSYFSEPHSHKEEKPLSEKKIHDENIHNDGYDYFVKNDVAEAVERLKERLFHRLLKEDIKIINEIFGDLK